MNNLNLLRPIAAAVVLTLFSVFALILFGEASLEDFLAGVTVLFIYGLILVFYLSRIALVFLGVFAVYKVLKQRASLGAHVEKITALVPW